jgi:diguanylate cyclase (GGDEF)-like protein
MGAGAAAPLPAEIDLTPSSSFRFLWGLLTPGGILVLAAWALQKEQVVQAAASPYAAYFCIGSLAAAVLLSWYYDQSRLLGCASAVTLAVAGFERWPGDLNVVRLAAFLLPVNFVLFALLKERGVMRPDGLVKVGLVVVQACAAAWIIGLGDAGLAGFLRWGERPHTTLWLPTAAQACFAVAAVTLATLAVVRRTKVEQGLLWALAAVFLGLNQAQLPVALFFYWGAAGLTLVFGVLDHGYEIAYRDELTGLPGRRAFTSFVEQLGGSYTIAMCDVDHFKSFNDRYGHEAGDQILKMVATKLARVGGGGRAFRYGGEEFLLVFRGRTAREAEPFVETIRQAIASAPLVPRAPDRPAKKDGTTDAPFTTTPFSISVSIGIAEKSKRHSTPELVVEAADHALYRAKEAGRNCVKLEDGTAA